MKAFGLKIKNSRRLLKKEWLKQVEDKFLEKGSLMMAY
jgi:hypothetical protein